MMTPDCVCRYEECGNYTEYERAAISLSNYWLEGIFMVSIPNTFIRHVAARNTKFKKKSGNRFTASANPPISVGQKTWLFTLSLGLS